jgi:methylenetetrahydrofolate/methylenetetrahydromethanopterin dehydrogenase (NADP+)
MEAKSPKPKILIQLDPDPQPSVFDAIVAIDAGVDHLLRHGGVEAGAVRDLVYGALFTRGSGDLRSTAIFIGGSNVAAGEEVFKAVKKTFFGPFRVSVLFDANGCNTTASAAVLAALEGMGGSLEGVPVAVVGGTGPVGQRVARLLVRLGAEVAIGSRSLDRARATAADIQAVTGRAIGAFATSGPGDPLAKGLERARVVVAAGTVGVTLLPESVRRSAANLKVAIDLNAVPPLGIEGIEPTDRGQDRDGLRAWGALGVGATKMKIHKKAVDELFTANDKVLDAEEVLELGRGLG